MVRCSVLNDALVSLDSATVSTHNRFGASLENMGTHKGAGGHDAEWTGYEES